MVELTTALRVVHFAAAVALAGEFAFVLWVARPALRESGQTAGAWIELRDRLMRVAAWCLVLVLVSGTFWFFVQAAAMSGASLAGAFDRETLVAVLSETLFGRVWIARLALAAALGAALVFLRRASPRREAMMLGVCAALAGGLLATLAWAGHAAAEQGAERIVHLSADVVHLLAAGAWLGALPALAFVLARARYTPSATELEFAARATRRFSTLGLASVGALVLTGAVNAWYTVGSVPALFGTGYGRLLSAKLVLFAAMVTLAAINRLRWTPRLSPAAQESAPIALSRLRRNAIAETALGLALLGIVGALGVTIPALHAQPVWPFSRTLDWDAFADSREIFLTALVIVPAAGAIAAIGVLTRRQEITAGGIAAAVVAVLTLIWLFAAPAHPTTYFQSPVPYDTASVVRGAPLYAEHCAACHGPYGNGDGPVADSLPQRPPNLAARLSVRREGDLLWSIQRGIGGTPMPAFGERISEERLWDVLNFMRAQANVDAGRRTDASVEPWRPVTAPEFTFQIGRGAQESLAQQRGRNIVLLVFYSLPQSLARLRALADFRLQFNRLGVRVIAVPMKAADAIPRDARGVDATMIAEPDGGVVAAYAMFTRTIADVGPPPAPHHVEFFIDRQGYLRARSVLRGKEPGWSPMSELLRQAVLLNKEKSRALAPRRHAH
jgi:putative copper export protein/mono/diheme cytochrome c family protein/peroxiredoxin